MYSKSIGSPHRYLTKKVYRRRNEFWPVYRRWVIGAIASLVVVVVIYLIVTVVIYSSRYQIDMVQITHGDNSTSEQAIVDQYITQMIGTNTSYLILRMGGRQEDVDMIRDTFPLIESVKIDDFVNNIMTISVYYHTPRLIRHVPGGARFGSYDEHLYRIASEYTPNGTEAILYLPAYLEWIDSIDGIYHEIPEADFVHIYHTVNKEIPLKHMIAYPGAWYVAMMTVDDLKILMSLHKPIEDQMKMYSNIYAYYPEAHRIRQIDVGSLDDAIVTLE